MDFRDFLRFSIILVAIHVIPPTDPRNTSHRSTYFLAFEEPFRGIYFKICWDFQGLAGTGIAFDDPFAAELAFFNEAGIFDRCLRPTCPYLKSPHLSKPTTFPAICDSGLRTLPGIVPTQVILDRYLRFFNECSRSGHSPGFLGGFPGLDPFWSISTHFLGFPAI
jgi:hypothetical protein